LVVAAVTATLLVLRGTCDPEPPAPAAIPRDEILALYRDRTPLRQLYRRLRLSCAGYEGLLRLVPPAGTIVDLGAGEGLLAHALAGAAEGKARRVVAVDHDPARVARLRAAASGRRSEEHTSELQSRVD